MTIIDYDTRQEYIWRDEMYPRFCPHPMFGFEDEYLVEFALICYPYARGHQFDENAYPPELRFMTYDPDEASTQFFFVTYDIDDGRELVHLTWEEAKDAADRLNDAYHDQITECIETWEWENMPFELSTDDLVASK